LVVIYDRNITPAASSCKIFGLLALDLIGKNKAKVFFITRMYASFCIIGESKHCADMVLPEVVQG